MLARVSLLVVALVLASRAATPRDPRRRPGMSTAGTPRVPYGERLVDDVLNRTETSTPQVHTFLAMELALKAERSAQRIDIRTQH
jgi:hypothetical protein